ncbi:MAG: U32 family peptidase C-terminal domain-containing protein, partial [Clostridia bacterium]|nr:U32 family peptidase C-terminal domain-containing protein [Clostridia bacterium]
IDNTPSELETEIFVHGAICFGYSGRCFLSDFLAGRSANLGDCAQSCRWAYNVYVEENNNPGNLMPVEHDDKGTYIFSSKDLCLIKEIPEIIEMGVDSLKIEGRLKTSYYLASVVNAYRNAIDDYMADPEHYDYTKYMNELEKTKTRSLTTFYFNDRNNKDFQEYEGKQYNPNFEFGGIVTKYDDEKSVIEIKNKLQIGDELEIIIPHKIDTVNFKIEKMWDAETDEKVDHVNPGKAGQSVKMKLPIKCEEGWILRRKK